MKKTIYVYPNPCFDTRFKCGISRLYQVFSRQYNYNMEIVDEEFLKEHTPGDDSNDILVIAGGDGTFHKAINTITAENLEKYLFGIMPGGTANEFAKSVRMPLLFEQAAETISLQNNIIQRKMGVVNGKCLFVTGFLYGIASYVLTETSQRAKFYFGEYAYPLPGLLAISNYEDFIKNFRINSAEFRTAYLLINNASLISKNIPVNTLNEKDNKLFSVVYLYSGISFGDLTRLVLKNQVKNNILQDPALFYTKKDQLKLEFDGDLEFLLDGESYKKPSPIEFTHSGQTLKIIV